MSFFDQLLLENYLKMGFVTNLGHTKEIIKCFTAIEDH